MDTMSPAEWKLVPVQAQDSETPQSPLPPDFSHHSTIHCGNDHSLFSAQCGENPANVFLPLKPSHHCQHHDEHHHPHRHSQKTH